MSYYELWSDVVYLYLSIIIIILYINIISSYHHPLPQFLLKKYGASSPSFQKIIWVVSQSKQNHDFLFCFPHQFLLPRVCCVVCYQIFLFFPLSPLSLQKSNFYPRYMAFLVEKKKRKKLLCDTHLLLTIIAVPLFFSQCKILDLLKKGKKINFLLKTKFHQFFFVFVV